jgi:hypothetical protein
MIPTGREERSLKEEVEGKEDASGIEKFCWDLAASAACNMVGCRRWRSSYL